MKGKLWVVLFAVLLGSVASAQDVCSDSKGNVVDCPDKGPELEIIGGGWVVLGADSESKIVPGARAIVDWKIAGAERPVHAHVTADFAGLTGSAERAPESASLLTFNALEFSFDVSYKPMPNVAAAGFCEGGFATRFTTNGIHPKTTAPLWGDCGVLFEDHGASRGRLKIGVGADERLGDEEALAAVIVSGSVKFGDLGPVGTTIMVRATLGLQEGVTGQRNNVVSIGAGVSWGSKRKT